MKNETPKYTTSEENEAMMQAVAPAPQIDPLLARQQQLRKEYQQITKQISEARQQEAMIKDMITSHTIEAAEIRGAMRENAIKQQEGALYGMD